MVDVTDEDRAAGAELASTKNDWPRSPDRELSLLILDRLADDTAFMQVLVAYGEARYRKGVEDAARVAEEWFPGDSAKRYPTHAVVDSIRKLGAV